MGFIDYLNPLANFKATFLKFFEKILEFMLRFLFIVVLNIIIYKE